MDVRQYYTFSAASAPWALHYFPGNLDGDGQANDVDVTHHAAQRIDEDLNLGDVCSCASAPPGCIWVEGEKTHLQRFRNRLCCRYRDDMTPCSPGNEGSSTLLLGDGADARWREDEEHFQSTIELAAIGIAHVNVEGRFIHANQWLCELLGYSREELLGLTVKEISHPDDKNATDEVRAQLHGGLIQSFQMEQRYVRKDGSTLWAGLTITVKRGPRGEPLYDISVIEEISARKLAEQSALRLGRMYAALGATNEAIMRARSPEELYQRVCDAAVNGGGLVAAAVVLPLPDALWASVAAATGTQWVREARFSVDEATVEGRGLTGTAFRTRRPSLSNDYLNDERTRPWHADARKAGTRAAAALPFVRGSRTIGVFILYSGDTGAFDEEVVKLGERMAENIVFALDNFEHEAERKSSEAELRRRHAELIELNAKLSQTQEQLLQSEKLASIGQLAAGVAHEINNPIAYVFSNFGMLQDYVEKLFDMLAAHEAAERLIGTPAVIEKLRTQRERIELEMLKEDIPVLMRESKEGITRVRKIVDALKDFSRLDSVQEWQFADLHQGIDSTLNIVNNEIKYKADVAKEYGQIPEIKCLPTQINQVIMNLLVNAGHAIGVKRGTITIRTGRDGDGVWIEVQDTGCGIPKESLSRIFDPFYTTKPVGKGTGLGLSLAYGIVQTHHGHISVHSEIGRGTTFRVTLPIDHADATNEAAAAA